MPLVSKCCCCCNLKYGYLAYGVICLIFRVCVITTVLFWTNAISHLVSGDSPYDNQFESFGPICGGIIGWFIATSIALFFALKGIIQERSILLYPYIVVLIFEIVVGTIANLILAALVSPIWLIKLVILTILDLYAAICLISLFQHMKHEERCRPVLQNMPLKTV